MELLKRIVKYTLIVLGVAFIFMIVLAASKLGDTPEVPVSQSVVNRMPSDFRDAYMEGCDPEGLQTSYCECSMSYLEANYSVEEILEVSVEYADTDVIPDIIYEAATSCLELYR